MRYDKIFVIIFWTYLFVENFGEEIKYYRPNLYVPNLLKNYSGPILACNQFQFCTERDRNFWKAQREIYNLILQGKDLSTQGPFVERQSSLVHALEERSRLCEDDSSAPFLLDKNSDDWPIACIWNGGASNGTCAPAPIMDEDFGYIEPNLWKIKVKQFRRKIGCNLQQIFASDSVQELYICRQNCLHLGIDYFSSLILSFGMVLALTSLILTS
uniref:Uncharacterized protein n=1 Tax=Panagrolaimus sp. JU765 TaxID=591449 RepID=A0AC34R4A2_9BILA